MEFIRPSADLRSKYNEMSKLCKETQEPIYITVNGRGDTILLSMAKYNSMLAELKLLQELAEGENEIRDGKFSPIEGTFDEIRKTLKALTSNE